MDWRRLLFLFIVLGAFSAVACPALSEVGISYTLSDGTQIELSRLLGEGHSAEVFAILPAETQVIKIAKTEAHRKTLAMELEHHKRIKKVQFPVAEIIESDVDPLPRYLIKQREFGPSLPEIIAANALTREMAFNLAELFILAYENNLLVDMLYRENFYWNSTRGSFVLVDSALRESPIPSIVKISEWSSIFESSPAAKIHFNERLAELRGESFASHAKAQEERYAVMAHAFRHEMEWVFGR